MGLQRGGLNYATDGNDSGKNSFPLVVNGSGASLPTAQSAGEKFLNTEDKKLYTAKNVYTWGTSVTHGEGLVFDSVNGIVSGFSDTNSLYKTVGYVWAGNRDYVIKFKLASQADGGLIDFSAGSTPSTHIGFVIKDNKIYYSKYTAAYSHTQLESKLLFDVEIRAGVSYVLTISKKGNECFVGLVANSTKVGANSFGTSDLTNSNNKISLGASYLDAAKYLTTGEIYLLNTSGDFVVASGSYDWDDGATLKDKTEYLDKSSGTLYLYSDGELVVIKPSQGASLFDIKTMAEAIAEKGWACLSHTSRKDIAKTDIPTMYADILDKYNNADSSVALSDKLSDVQYDIKNIVYLNGAYYTAKSGTEQGIYKSTDGNTWTKVKEFFDGLTYTSYEYKPIYTYGNKIFFVWANGYFVVFDTSTDTGSKSASQLIDCQNNRRPYLFMYDGKLYFTSINDGKVHYVNLDELDAELTNAVSLDITTMPIAYDGIYFYGTTTTSGSYRDIVKGTSIDSMTTSVVSGYFDPSIGTTYTPNSTEFVISIGKNIIQINNGTATTVDCSSYFSGNISYLNQIGDDLYAFNSGNSSNTSYKSSDNGTTWEAVFEDNAGIACISGANGKLFMTGTSSSKLYIEVNVPIVYTDTYFIDGSSVEIEYYKNGSFKICLADGGTNDTNLATVYSYLGYYNYYVLDTENETLSLPRNSNLWTYMYVGDNYEDSNLPTGIPTRLLPQAENINITGATPTITISANKTYSFDTAITSLTISDVETSALESVLYFTTGAGTISLSAPNTLRWGGGNEMPQLEPNTVYCIAIRNGLAEIDNFGTTA